MSAFLLFTPVLFVSLMASQSLKTRLSASARALLGLELSGEVVELDLCVGNLFVGGVDGGLMSGDGILLCSDCGFKGTDGDLVGLDDVLLGGDVALELADLPLVGDPLTV